ncbi:Lipopolysaccharide-modifying protein [Kalmanozyma brasiliensis GHG001]|uniref:Glycosyl transferase CAP10 domain-containing protein n=1 Tax=Kalmanozyma brasiliensis (strain GHG001) TaxID=1365824 RepID=V5ESZ4_KALBG|nr:Lipopolysaccharide-modifying protein [Kalmanozyma brasiliensis GHG001]EST05069.1 Lipopolysaccharide-modifying protein [Kalmanozyma brasiliensis GHG001]
MAGRSSGSKRRMTLQDAQGAPMAGFAGLFVGLCLVFSFIPLSTFFPGYDTSPTGQQSLPRRLQNDLNLPQPVCKTEFSNLYQQLMANEAAWRRKGGIKHADVQNAAQNCRHGCVHVVIKYGQIFVRGQAKDWQSRVRSTLQLLASAYQGASEEEKDAIEGAELVISTADFDGFTDPVGSRGAGWVLDRRVGDKEGQYLFPDFSFASWPEAGIASYPEFRRQAAQVNAETPWRTKSNPAFWRGDALAGNHIKPRESLLSVATGPGSELWSDVKRTSFWEEGPDIGKIVSPPEHCRHKFLVHSEGVAYSGRSKFILGCESTVVMHALEWEQHFHPALISNPNSADRNHVLLDGAYFEGLPATMQALIAEERAGGGMTTGERIARNAKRTLTDRYLTPAATACYIRAALISYRRAMDARSWPTRQGAVLELGGGVKPGAGTPKGTLKELGVKGDIEYGVWLNLGMPEWPPQ